MTSRYHRVQVEALSGMARELAREGDTARRALTTETDTAMQAIIRDSIREMSADLAACNERLAQLHWTTTPPPDNP